MTIFNCHKHNEFLIIYPFFRFLASGETYHSLRFQYRISIGEISRIVKKNSGCTEEDSCTPIFTKNIQRATCSERPRVL